MHPDLIDFRTCPEDYRHWKLSIDGAIATLSLDVDEDATLRPGYALKQNSYDLGVDIELSDAVQRLRFEHPQVGAIILRSAHPTVFCAGANIQMLGASSHGHKVNFCKFTNETRMAIEDASRHSGQTYLAAIHAPCAGGGYELALACDEILLVDDGACTVSLPELPLLAVLPGTGGLTRLVDKRRVRRDRADFFCTTAEGLRGQRALDWGFVDAIAPRSRFDDVVLERALAAVVRSGSSENDKGVALGPLERELGDDLLRYPPLLSIALDRARGVATFVASAPSGVPPASPAAARQLGAQFWPLAFARALEDAILHLRLNEFEIGTWVFETSGDADPMSELDAFLCEHAGDWFVRECTLYLKRTFQRLDVSARSLLALITPGSCFVGTLLELALAADRTYMLDGTFEDDERPPATVRASVRNFGAYPIANGLTRFEGRLLGEPETLKAVRARAGHDLEAAVATELGIATFGPDDIDWDDEVRLAIEERASFSPDALSGLEANLRFAGPETTETKIFSRLSAWQNWIFQRPNAVGVEGALSVYGSGTQARFDKKRS